MSYTEEIPAEQLASYQIVDDWNKYYDDLVKSKSSMHGVVPPVSIEITSCIIESESGFIGNYGYSIRFHNCYFKKTMSFFQCIFKNDITFTTCFFDDGFFFIEDVIFNNNFHLFACSFKKFIVAGGVFNKCYWNISDCETCNIGWATFEDLRLIVDKKGIKEFILWANQLFGVIAVTGEACIEKFKLEGFSKSLSLSIEDIFINKLDVLRFRSDDGLRLLNLKPNGNASEILISESYLGKAEFYLVDFSKFASVSIVDSHVLDCSFINVIWPKEVEGMQAIFFQAQRGVNPKGTLISREEFFKWRETFRQLKYAYSKQGDLINEQKFHALEMIAYDSALKWKGNRVLKLIIKFSNWFSKFGQSVSRPVAALLIGNFIIFFTLLLAGLFAPLKISIQNPNWQGLSQGVYRYVWLINPLRKVDDTFNDAFIILDMLARIWSSYMIYNIIRATRRFIK